MPPQIAVRNLNLRAKSTPAKVFLWFLILAYIALFSVVTVSRHLALETHAYDLVNMDQAVWNTLQGNLLGVSLPPGGDTRLVWHFEPIFLPISLLYFLYNGAETLLVLQTVLIGLGALPVFWLARDKFENEWPGVVFALLYLLYPSIQSGNNFDFHAVTLAAPFLLFAIYGIETEHRKTAVLFSILAMSTKEEIPLLILMLGGYTFFFRDKKLGLSLVTLAAAWFFIGFKVIIPHFNSGGGSQYNARYRMWGDTQSEMARTILTNPGKVWQHLTSRSKLVYYGILLFPFAFIPLLAPQWLLLAAPSFAINLLSNEAAQSLADEYHYPAPIVPFVVVAAIMGGDWITRQLSNRLRIRRTTIVGFFLGALLATSLYQQYYRGYSPLAFTFSWPKQTDHDRIGLEIMETIPPDAAVSAQSDLAPHLSHRENIFLFPQNLDKADYIMLDVTSIVFPIRAYKEYHDIVTEVMASGFGVAASKDGYLLLERGEGGTAVSPEFYTFTLADADNTTPQQNIQAVFDNNIHFTGYTLEQKRNSTLRLQTYWTIDQPVNPGTHIKLTITHPDGRVLKSVLPITTYWRPMSEWPTNTPIIVDFGNINLSSYPDGVGLSVGVTTAVKDIPPEIISSPIVPPTSAGQKTLLLTQFCHKNIILLNCAHTSQFDMPSSAEKTNHNFEGKIELAGYDIASQTIEQNSELILKLYWRKIAPLDKDLAVFVHLTTEKPWEIFGQKDKQPWDGEYPTSRWQLNEIITDEYKIALPQDIQPGNYVLRIGLYDPLTGERLLLTNLETGEDSADHLYLLDIKISE